MMEIKFDPNQNHQRIALESISNVFEGQELNKTMFSMPTIQRNDKSMDDLYSNQTESGYANRLRLPPETILENIRKIQLKNGLKQFEGEIKNLDFTVEMETGTGKTYVYLRSVFEMNRLYGFTKFIIVVPSIAIKEGVLKSMKMTDSHFKELYDNTPFDYFTYNSSDLSKVRSFATNDYIQIMVINIDAFRKSFKDPLREASANIIHRWNDKMQGVPIEFIKETKPVVIIDEPQSVDTTEKSSEAIASLNPLCTFRYSATHVEKHHMLYRLNSIDAYEQRLVKQISVAPINVKDGNNKAYIKLLSVDNKNGHRARIEVDVQQAGSVKRKPVWVKSGQDLMELTKRSIYDGYIINDIYCEEGSEYIDFTSKNDIIHLHHAIGEVNENEYKRLQIQKTIEEHLDKELQLTPMGIKVLSLFFIDRVSNYRDYGAPDQKGKYALMFEDEYRKAIKKPKYNSLFSDLDTDSLPELVHEGYFSADKGILKDTKGTTAADEDTYSLIMKDKEKLLMFDSKLKFIFSHSALKEGWDNPNVFQICTLNETKSVIKKRQEIGRGLRIAVNQDGDRVHGFEVNTLTVMINESYKDFVDGLQKEIEKEEGIVFNVINDNLFANIVIQDTDGKDAFLGIKKSENIYKHFLIKQYIDPHDKATDSLRTNLKNGTVDLPEEHAEYAEKVFALLRRVVSGLNIKNNNDKRTVKLNKAVFQSPEFKELWDKIKHRTTYNVNFNPDDLVKSCAEKIKNTLVVGKTKFTYEKATLEITRAGVDVTDLEQNTYVYNVRDFQIPDILSFLQNETNLKRKSILDILVKSGRLEDFKKNPQKFIDEVKGIIKREMQHLLIDGIKYQRIGDDCFYEQGRFENKELIGYLNKNMIEAKRSIYDHIVYDSDTESKMAESFETNSDVKVYAKLPSWFKIDTPLGTYNPDWAVLMEMDGIERLYFVVETKNTNTGTVVEDLLKSTEQDRIKCGRAHFEALGTDAKYIVASNYETLLNQI